MLIAGEDPKNKIEKTLSCLAARVTIPELELTRKVRPIECYKDENQCWVETSHRATSLKGKPLIFRNNKVHILARYVYELLRGTIPERRILVNTCWNIRCCNPDHYSIEEKGYFNTRKYMKAHNPEHYKRILKANRTTKKNCGRINYGRLFARIENEFGDTFSESNSELSKLASQERNKPIEPI